MKILIDFQDTAGGAPRSLKEHALLLKGSGHEIIAVISQKKYENFFDDTGFQVIHLPRFYTRYFSKNVIIFYKYCRFIKQKKIDLIYTNRVIQCQFLSIVSDFCKLPILNARAGGFGISDIVKIQKDKHYIIYSEENLQTFKNFGFSDSNLFLLRNRISIPIINNINKDIPVEKIIITITGSIKTETIEGLIWFLDFIVKISPKSHFKGIVNLAGGNLLKTSEDMELFEKQLKDAQNSMPENWEIKQLGWVENINEIQANSHICIGKGRSVIQPAMLGKIAFVISEAGTLYRCKKETYNDLLFYNFSGRGIINEKTDSSNEFKELLIDSNSFLAYQEEAENLMQKFKEDYATEYVKEKLEEIIHYVKSSQKMQFGLLKCFKKLFLVYTYSMLNKIRKTKH